MRRGFLLFALVALATTGCTAQITDISGPSGASKGGSAGGQATNGDGGAAVTPAVESPSPRLLRQLTLSEYGSTVTDLLHLTNPDTTAIPPDVTVDGYTTNVTGTFVTQSYMDAYSSVGAALAERAVSESYTAL